jgi:glycosyltransferase involved in cell wall biosynthesis
MGAPLVSVVVATRDRPQRLERLLDGLRAQTLTRDAFEVIVVADGATSPTTAVLAAAQARSELRIRVVRHAEPQGPGAARNAGWRAALAPLVAFTDDDCVPEPEWLEAALQAARPGAFVQGRTEPNPAELVDDGLLSRTLRTERLGPQYETCNIVYPREALQSLGGFDERFGLAPGGEDTDLAWRAIDAGLAPVFAPNAVVFHAVERLGVRGTLRVAARWTATTRIFAEHPQTRSMLYRGLFWNAWHYLLWRSVLALAAPRWLRRMLLTAHLLELRRRARAGGAGWWAVPFLVVHDVVECWAIARGAVRYRTLVL